MKYKTGDKVTVIGNSNLHDFKYGEVVKLVRLTSINGPCWFCEGADGDQWVVVEDDIEPYPTMPPIYTPYPYTGQKLECGKYLVMRKDGKTHFEVWNGTGWAYNEKVITHYYLPIVQ